MEIQCFEGRKKLKSLLFGHSKPPNTTRRLFRVIIGRMASLLSDTEKAALVSDFKNVVDTFLRALTVYEEPEKTIVVSDPNYNPYEAFNQNNLNITNTPRPVTVYGRILYDKNQEWSFMRPQGGNTVGEPAIKVKDTSNVRACRIKVDAAGHAILQRAKKYEIDGILFDRESEPRPHGLFGVDHYTYYFKRSL